MNSGLRQIAFFVVPSAVAFLALGDVVAAALFQTGRFTYDDAVYVWAILGGFVDRTAGDDAGASVFVDATTRCATPARRCDTRSRTWASQPCSDISPPSFCRR